MVLYKKTVSFENIVSISLNKLKTALAGWTVYYYIVDP